MTDNFYLFFLLSNRNWYRRRIEQKPLMPKCSSKNKVHCIADIYAQSLFLALKWPFPKDRENHSFYWGQRQSRHKQGVYFIIVLWADYSRTKESAQVNRFQWTPWTQRHLLPYQNFNFLFYFGWSGRAFHKSDKT